jgi:hypothetical protein
MHNAEIPVASAEHKNKHRRHASAVPSGTRTQDITTQAEGSTRLKPVGVTVTLTYKNISRHEHKLI